MLGDRIKELRNEKGITQQQLADLLTVAKSTIGMWENNKREPDIETIKKIADILGAPTAFLLNDTVKIGKEFSSDDSIDHCCPICGCENVHIEKATPIDFQESSKSSGYALQFWCEANHYFYIVIEDYKGINWMTYTDENFHAIRSVLQEKRSSMDAKMDYLDSYGRKAVHDLLETEYGRCISQASLSETEQHIEIRLSRLSASAGMGDPLSDEAYETITVKRTPESERADFAIRVNGDSMEETYSDGDILLVESTPQINNGDIGIFVVNGEGYVKEFGGNRLISHNSSYADIMLHDYDVIMCSGRVIGVADLV